MNPLWKEYFYFSKRDKIASFVLLLLIMIVGSVYYFSDSIFRRNSVQNNTELLAEFERFQLGLREIDIEAESEETEVAQKPAVSAISVQATKEETIDINSATATDLKKLPGIGDAYANRIIEYRANIGGFVNIEQLMEVQGITQARFEKIKPFLLIGQKHSLVYINRFGEEELLRHPYLDKQQVKVICRIRQEQEIKSLEQLRNTGSFSPRELEKLKDYLSFD